jgi:hypothetical protein
MGIKKSTGLEHCCLEPMASKLSGPVTIELALEAFERP